MKRSLRYILPALTAVIACGPACADGLRCTTFLHNRDGSWRSFEEADIEGPDGIVHLSGGEILRSGDRSAKGDIARALDELCGH